MRLVTLFSPLVAIVVALTANATEEATIGPAPDWVIPPPPLQIEAHSENGGYRYHLADIQHHLETSEKYAHLVISMINQSGVEEFSQLDFNYIPEYQTLTLHHITIEREGVLHDRLNGAKIETLRREQGMEQQLYDGALTSLIVLEDVRPGDVLSYAYTVRGHNPVLNDFHHQFIQLAYRDPIDHIRRRIVWDPAKRQVRWQLNGGANDKTVERTANELEELVWEDQQVARITPEKSTPSWFTDYPEIEYSDCPDWKTFGDWTLTLYQRDEPLPAEAADLCEKIRTSHATDDARIIAVLDWVQSNIRYLGSFFGEHTHEPYPLDDIWRRRFGDCKDKGMLTIAMLRHLGYDVAPALVNSSLSHTLTTYLPGPSLFNHFVVHLHHDGNDYFLDPTHTYQRGPLRDRDTPDYGYVFIVRPGSTQLTTTKRCGIEINKTVIHETYTINSLDSDATLTVETIATGGDANALRSQFASTSHEEISESYRKFYANEFQNLETTSPIKFIDAPTTNRVVIHEHYRIPEFWSRDKENERWHSWIQASCLNSSLSFPEKQQRKNPLRHRFPLNLDQHIRVNLPEAWDIETVQTSINDPAFTYSYSTKLLEKGFTIDHCYRSLAKHIDPANFDKYQQAMDNVAEKTSMEIWHYANDSKGAKASDNVLGTILIVATTTIGLILGTILAILGWLWNPQARKPDSSSRLVGIGGWLFFPMLGTILGPLAIIILIFSYFSGLETINANLATESGFGIWHSYYITDSLINATLLPLTILNLVLLFTRRTSFPWTFILLQLLVVGTDIILVAIETGMEGLAANEQTLTSLPGLIISSLIWCSYMLSSQRVKATFTRRRGNQALTTFPQTPPPVPPPAIST